MSKEEKKTNAKKREEKPSLGISEFLPEEARMILLKAYAQAFKWPDHPKRRAYLIDTAIEKVKRCYPQYFRTED